MRRVQSFALGTLSLAALVAAMNLSPLGHSASAASSDEADKVDPPKIAVCAIPMLVNELMGSDRFKPDRDKLEEELKGEYQGLQDELTAFSEKNRGMKRDDPAFGEAAQKFRDLQQRIGEKQREIAEKLEAKSAEQLLACYELARSSASAVAESMGYNYVMASVGADEKISGENVELALRQMMARPVVMAPKNADITEDVRADLKL